MGIIQNGSLQSASAASKVTSSGLISTAEVITGTTYVTATTPDQVTVTVPSNGLLAILFDATWKNSVASDGRAAIFIDGTQVVLADSAAGAPAVAAVSGNSSADVYRPLVSGTVGLQTTSSAVAYTGDVTTGQIIAGNVSAGNGGPCWVKIAAGSHTVSIRYRSAAGGGNSITVKDRTLRVITF